VDVAVRVAVAVSGNLTEGSEFEIDWIRVVRVETRRFEERFVIER
jgi:hypothetical protein